MRHKYLVTYKTPLGNVRQTRLNVSDDEKHPDRDILRQLIRGHFPVKEIITIEKQ